MKREVITIPKSKSPFEVLLELGDKTKKAWIFLNKDAFSLQRENAHHYSGHCQDLRSFSWKDDEKKSTDSKYMLLKEVELGDDHSNYYLVHIMDTFNSGFFMLCKM